MQNDCELVFTRSSSVAAMYFMQPERSNKHVLRVLREFGWHHQNLNACKKKILTVPSTVRFGKSHQVIAIATRGYRARTFNRLRTYPPVLQWDNPRGYGLFVSDDWDDRYELTSGYFAGVRLCETAMVTESTSNNLRLSRY